MSAEGGIQNEMQTLKLTPEMLQPFNYRVASVLNKCTKSNKQKKKMFLKRGIQILKLKKKRKGNHVHGFRIYKKEG